MYYPRSFKQMPHRRTRDTERRTENCSELYNHKANADPSVLNCPQTHKGLPPHPLPKKMEAAVQSLKKGKSAGVDDIPAKLVHGGGESGTSPSTTLQKRSRCCSRRSCIEYCFVLQKRRKVQLGSSPRLPKSTARTQFPQGGIHLEIRLWLT